MTSEQRNCHGTDARIPCSAPALYVATVPHGQRFACESCAAAPEVTARQPIAEFFAQVLGPGVEALIEEEQQRCRELVAQVFKEEWPPPPPNPFNPPPRRPSS